MGTRMRNRRADRGYRYSRAIRLIFSGLAPEAQVLAVPAMAVRTRFAEPRRHHNFALCFRRVL